jgi:hypothetical protein
MCTADDYLYLVSISILFVAYVYIYLFSGVMQCVLQMTIFLHYLWVGPLQAVAVLVLLWYELGVACLAGFLLLLLLIPLQACMGKLFSKLRCFDLKLLILFTGKIVVSCNVKTVFFAAV